MEYIAQRTAALQEDLLSASKPAWEKTVVVAWGPSRYETRFRASWNDDGLYARFDARDPNPWHTMTRRDDHIWEEEVVEIFLDPNRTGRDYGELEISPINVVCDLRIREPWPNLRNDVTWDIEGLVTRVTSYHEADQVKPAGWIATAFMPWPAFRSLPTAATLPPRPGDRWRFNVYRIKRPLGPADPRREAVFAAWSPTGGPSFHMPNAFRDLVFGE